MLLLLLLMVLLLDDVVTGTPLVMVAHIGRLLALSRLVLFFLSDRLQLLVLRELSLLLCVVDGA